VQLGPAPSQLEVVAAMAAAAEVVMGIVAATVGRHHLVVAAGAGKCHRSRSRCVPSRIRGMLLTAVHACLCVPSLTDLTQWGCGGAQSQPILSQAQVGIPFDL
jgi:hypothetical protein